MSKHDTTATRGEAAVMSAVEEYRKWVESHPWCANSSVTDRAEDALDELLQRLERAESWEGVLDFIDRTYPARIFTGASGDPGPRLIVLLRELKRAEAELAEVRRDITVAYRLWLQRADDEMGGLLKPHSTDVARHDAEVKP